MATTKNIPETDAAFLEKSKAVTAYIAVNNERLKVDNIFFTQTIQPAQTRWENKYAAYLPIETRTPLATAEKNNAKNDYMPLFRELVGGVLRNPNVTDDDLAAMELNRPDSIHTPAPVPSTWPVVLTDLNTPSSVILHFTDSASGKRAKPHKVSGAVVRYAILAAPPTDMDELNNSVLDTQTPCLLTFPEAQRGNRLYYCLAWQNTRGEKGPWSRIEMAIVP